MSNNQKLGRGLSALLGEERKFNDHRIKMTNVGKGFTVYQLPIEKIIAGIYQPRTKFNQESIESLAISIKEYGIIQPIIVRKTTKDQDIYEIISGERRFRAAKHLNFKEIPAIIRDIDNDQTLAISILENVQREDLSVLEEAHSYKQLINEFEYSQKDISEKIGKSRSHIANILRLLSLPKEIHQMLDNNLITIGHAKLIINRHDAVDIAKKIIKDSLSVRQTEILCSDNPEIFFKENIIKNSTENKITNTDIDINQKNKLNNISDNLKKLMGKDIKISSKINKNGGKIIISYKDLSKIENSILKLIKQNAFDF